MGHTSHPLIFMHYLQTSTAKYHEDDKIQFPYVMHAKYIKWALHIEIMSAHQSTYFI